MTQTITKLNNEKDTATVDVYYHPNNSSAKITDPDSRFCYSLFCNKFDFSDFKEYMENKEGEELECDIYDNIQEIIECFKNSKTRYIWSVGSSGGHDDYCGYFATKQEAIDDMMSQDC